MVTTQLIHYNLAEELERVRLIRLQTDPSSAIVPTKTKPECDFCDDLRLVRIERAVDDPQFGKLVPCPKCNTPAFRHQRLIDACGLRKFADASFQDYWDKSDSRKNALVEAKRVIQKKGWLTMWGPYGNGKSYIGAAICNECLRVGLGARHFDMADLLDFLRAGFKQTDGFEKRFEEVCTVPCLVVDEADVFNATGWAYEKFRQIVQARYRACSSTVTVWILNPEPVVGNTAVSEGLDFLFSRMSEFVILGVDDGDIRPELAKGLL